MHVRDPVFSIYLVAYLEPPQKIRFDSVVENFIIP